MASFTKTYQTALLSLQSLTSGGTAVSSVLDVSTQLAASVLLRFGRTVTTALTAGLIYTIEGSFAASGDADWGVIGGCKFVTNTALVADEAVNGTCNAGQKVVGMASTTGFTVGMMVFIKNSTFGDSEFGVIAKVDANTSITLVDNLVNAQTGSTVYADAQVFNVAELSLSSYKRIRCVANGGGTGQAVAIQAQINTCDSIG